ncbi:MAG TPA: hypothetical protein DCP92_19250 [Nitrospiraceae bacterium]|jgi:hypothetical protein|nr:hypothetical protein [Nitrospiraceae bacterium]
MQKLTISEWIKNCLLFFVVTFSLVLTGCSSTSSLPTFNVTGSWFIYTTVTGTPGVEGPEIFTFTQAESTVSGSTPLALAVSGNVSGVNIVFSWTGTDGYLNTYAGIVNGEGSMAGSWASTNGTSGIWSGIIETVPSSTVVEGSWTLYYVTAGLPGVQGPFLFEFTQSVNSIAGTGSVGGQPITVIGSVGNLTVLFYWTDSDGFSHIFTGQVGLNGTMSGTWTSTNGLLGTWSGSVISADQ